MAYRARALWWYLGGAAAARTGDEMSGPALLLLGFAVSGRPGTGSAMLSSVTIAGAAGGPVFGALLDRSRRPDRVLAGPVSRPRPRRRHGPAPAGGRRVRRDREQAPAAAGDRRVRGVVRRDRDADRLLPGARRAPARRSGPRRSADQRDGSGVAD